MIIGGEVPEVLDFGQVLVVAGPRRVIGLGLSEAESAISPANQAEEKSAYQGSCFLEA
jgi:hypothetical protein